MNEIDLDSGNMVDKTRAILISKVLVHGLPIPYLWLKVRQNILARWEEGCSAHGGQKAESTSKW